MIIQFPINNSVRKNTFGKLIVQSWSTRNHIYDDLLYKYLSALYFYQHGLIVESDSISVASDIPSVFNGSCCNRNTSLTR